MLYTSEEKEFLIGYFPGHHYREIQAAFQAEFGKELTMRQIKAFGGNNKLKTGYTGCFTKGHVPANKGKTMPKHVYDKAAPTMFKPGQKPPNTLPVGTEKMLADGYIWIKINDAPCTKKQTNWIQKHRHVWMQHNGPIPKGQMVTFLDGDRTNCEIENLALISKAENARMNQNKLYSTDRDLTRTGIYVARLKTNLNKRKNEKKKRP